MKRLRKRHVLILGAGLLAVAVLGFGVAASGVMPITASSGHWRITSWFLHFSMRRSVATHSLGVDTPPDLDDQALVLRGAGHYEGGCRFCHGAPGDRAPRVPRAMTPKPPPLPDVAKELSPDELFYVVKHGVKFTAMPAWPAQARDDEVWAVVAFMKKLPTLDRAGYHALVFGEEPGHDDEDKPAARFDEAGLGDATLPPEDGVASGAFFVRRCARCHGRDGSGRGRDAFPKLNGQREVYLLDALRAYANGDRASGIMEPVAAAMTDEEMRAVARVYARQPAMTPTTLADADTRARGRVIANEGIEAQRIPACADCHGPTEHPRHEAYPRLAGQSARYLEAQLGLFRAGVRGGSARAELMQPIEAHYLSEAQRHAVAVYYASLAR